MTLPFSMAEKWPRDTKGCTTTLSAWSGWKWFCCRSPKEEWLGRFTQPSHQRLGQQRVSGPVYNMMCPFPPTACTDSDKGHDPSLHSEHRCSHHQGTEQSCWETISCWGLPVPGCPRAHKAPVVQHPLPTQIPGLIMLLQPSDPFLLIFYVWEAILNFLT